MNKYYLFTYQHNDDDYYEEKVCIAFDRLLTSEQEEFLVARLREIYKEADYVRYCLLDAAEDVLGEFMTKFGFNGRVGANPYVSCRNIQ